GDFVPHAGIAILHVIAVGVASPPKFVQIAWQTAGRAHHDIARAGDLIDNADYFSLTDWRTYAEVVNAVDFLLPRGAESLHPRAIGFFHLEPSQRFSHFLKGDPRVPNQRQRRLLTRVEFAHIHVHKSYRRILKC